MPRRDKGHRDQAGWSAQDAENHPTPGYQRQGRSNWRRDWHGQPGLPHRTHPALGADQLGPGPHRRHVFRTGSLQANRRRAERSERPGGPSCAAGRLLELGLAACPELLSASQHQSGHDYPPPDPGARRRAHRHGARRTAVRAATAESPGGIHHHCLRRPADWLHALCLLQRRKTLLALPLHVQARGHHRETGQRARRRALKMLGYCESPYFLRRRRTREVVVGDPRRGGVIIGSDHPVVIQSMITCDTMDTAECVKQTLELVAVGCQIVRITAPTVKDAANLQNIVAELHARGCYVPIVADIHFKPDAALEAARWVEMVRINPGNYADSKKFAIKEYSDQQYAAELARIEEKFTPLVKLCQELGRALRIGTNHGSLSDRIMNRFGDSPLGMVESALEFARIARKHDFHNFKFSMKSSNPKIMIHCYRLLVARLEQEGADWNYPIHLGVTEAGEGEDGRIKSAIGIGSLLCDGLGDTIRVSLTEDSPREIEVCHDLLAQIPLLSVAANVSSRLTGSQAVALLEISRVLTNAATWPFDPFHFEKRETPEIELAD